MSLDSVANRSSFFSAIGADPLRVTAFRQSHSTDVAVITAPGCEKRSGDGGITAAPGLALAITVADCLPIVVFNKRQGCFGVVHSGWKGTGIALKAVELMTKHYGSHPDDIVAVIGPGIGPCCYNVTEERACLFTSLAPDSVDVRNGDFFLDLKEANRSLLVGAGVGRVVASEICTCCSLDLGSYRRQGPDDFTRMVAVIGFF
jgi:polyphenol oxidase